MTATALAAALALAAEEPAPRCASFDLSLAGIGSLEEDLARAGGLAGSAPLWPGLLRRPSGARPLWLCDGGAPAREAIADPTPPPGPSWEIVPPAFLAKYHGGWADDRNDGALWAGRGISALASAGVRFRWRWLTLQLAPSAAWQENRAFHAPASSTPGQSPYANPFNYGAIDLPLRMGPGAFWTGDLGQSFVRVDAWNLALGLSTESLWWGPGIRNSLLMSDSAPGFPHVFLGTSRPLDAWIGFIEFELLWGRLAESKWFDSDPTNDRRLFEGAVLTYEPAFARGLTLGFARVFVFPTADVSLHHYLDPIVQPPFQVQLPGARGSDFSPDNQLGSIFFRWAFPEVHFAVWGEWARDDHAFNVTDFLQEPGHSQAWQLGLEKLFPAGRGFYRLQAEMTHTFEMPPNNPTRGTPIFYTHSGERQGYTNRGQMLGAGLGPQGDTQFLAVDRLLGPGQLGLFVERVVRNERWYYDHLAGAGNKVRHDLTMTLGTRGAWAFREWDLQWEVGVSHRYNLNFGLAPDSPDVNHAAVTALDATLSVRWWPGRGEAPMLPAPLAPGAPSARQ